MPVYAKNSKLDNFLEKVDVVVPEHLIEGEKDPFRKVAALRK